MINLLSNRDKRRLAFAELLSNTDGWLTLTEISQTLNCSTRVLKDDMTHFRKNSTDFSIQSSNQGIRLLYGPKKGLKSLYQQVLSESTAYQLLEAIFLYEGKTVTELAEHLYLSSSTVYRLVEQINKQTATYGFEIQKNICSITGDEESIRYYFYRYFYEKYSFIYWPFENIDESYFNKFIAHHLNLTQMKDDYAYFNKFKIITAVNLVRSKNEHYIDTENIELTYQKIAPDIDIKSELFQEFESTFDMTYDNHLITQLFTHYVGDNFSFNYDHLMKKAAENETIANEVAKLTEILDRLSDEIDIPIPNKERVISAIRNIIHLDYLEPQSNYILYNHDKYFVDHVKKEFPHFYVSIHSAMKELRQALGKPETEEGVNFYIYTVFTYWKGLIPKLRDQFPKIKVTVISDRHTLHAHMIKDFIAHEFSNQIELDIFTGVNLNKEILENLDCDVIVTNFPMPLLEKKRSVYIEIIPGFNDLVKLQNVFEEIVSERLEHKN